MHCIAFKPGEVISCNDWTTVDFCKRYTVLSAFVEDGETPICAEVQRLLILRSGVKMGRTPAFIGLSID